MIWYVLMGVGILIMLIGLVRMIMLVIHALVPRDWTK